MVEGAAQAATPADDSRPLWLEKVRGDVDALMRPGSVTLVCAKPTAREVEVLANGEDTEERLAGSAMLTQLGRVLGMAPVSVTEIGLAGEPARGWQDLLERLEECPLLYDLEALCWDPWLGLDVRRFLEMHARRSGVVALWPGRVSGRVAVFSAPGREDHQRVELGGWRVLRPVATRFPDEVPFEVERVAR